MSRHLRLVPPDNVVRLDVVPVQRPVTRGDCVDGPRPVTRGDCVDGPRPCPWVSCRHHLYLDRGRRSGGNGARTLPEYEPGDLEQSCSLDLADRGALTLDLVAETIDLTRERARQIEAVALKKLQRKLKNLAPDDVDRAGRRTFVSSKDTIGRTEREPELLEDDDEDATPGLAWRAWSPEVLVHGPDVLPVTDAENADGTITLGSLWKQRQGADRATFAASSAMAAAYEQRLVDRGLVVRKKAEPRISPFNAYRPSKKPMTKGSTMSKHADNLLEALTKGRDTSATIASHCGLAAPYVVMLLKPLIEAGKVVAVGKTSTRRYYLPGSVPTGSPKSSKPALAAKAPKAPKTPKKARVSPSTLVAKAETVAPISLGKVLDRVQPSGDGYRVAMMGAVVECPNARAAFDLLLLAQAHR